MDDIHEVSRAKAFIDRIAKRALAMEGTCTGEHGIGQGKKHYLEPDHGAAAVHAMHAIKTALDPAGIMNPGRLCSGEDCGSCSRHPEAADYRIEAISSAFGGTSTVPAGDGMPLRDPTETLNAAPHDHWRGHRLAMKVSTIADAKQAQRRL